MALSDKKILEEKKRGNIFIEPFKEDNLGTSSYDVTLGEFYFREQNPKHHHNIYNIYNKEHVDQVWNTKHYRAGKASKEFEKFNFDYTGIKKSDRVIVLQPGETILAHTDEFIGGKNIITTMMKARSSLGRSFIEVCKCAGWGDVGYTNRWTMEITNNSRRYAIPLVVGRRIAQIVFFNVGPIRKKNYTNEGKYQTEENTETLRESWDPKMMLPRLYNDREIKK